MDNKDELAPQDKETNNEKNSGSNKFLGFVKRNPLFVTILVCILIIVGVYGFMSQRINRIERTHKAELLNTIEVINADHIKNNVRVFSWAIRSELIRENIEQVDQFFRTYLNLEFKNAKVSIQKVQLVNPETREVQLSTNSKDEDKMIEDDQIINASSLLVLKEGSIIRIANPIKGLDKTIGIVIVELEMKE